MDITFCTLFFDIGRGEWSNYAMHSNTYMYWFKNVLSLDINLYIETEEKFVDIIKSNRRVVDPEFKKTIIKILKVEELDAYKKFNHSLEHLMFSDAFKENVHHNVPEMTKPLYNVLMFNKLCTLQNAINKNPFNTEYFSWVDTGFIRDETWIIGNEKWPVTSKLNLKPDKIKFFCINDTILSSLQDKKFHCMSQVRFLKGTIFFIHKNLLKWLLHTFDQKVIECINSGFIGSDEKIFDLCYLENPNNFELVKCDWRKEFQLYSIIKDREYSFEVSWNIDEISKSDSYRFWYIGIEDDTTKVIYRNDLNPFDHPHYLNFTKNVLPVSFKSQTKPFKVVIWPVDAHQKWLNRIEYNLKVD